MGSRLQASKGGLVEFNPHVVPHSRSDYPEVGRLEAPNPEARRALKPGTKPPVEP